MRNPVIPMELLMFSKKLAEYEIREAGKIISNMGLDGVDLTVRPGGHIEPEEAVERLPGAVEVLGSEGLTVPMISTGIRSAEEKWSREIFSTASKCGIGYLKLGYWHYEGFGNVRRQLEDSRSKAAKLAELASEHGVVAGIHIHSGNYMSATGGMVERILDGIDTEYLGAYIDPGHMVLEGGRSGWRLGMDLLRDVIRMVAVKDFGWERNPKWEENWNLLHMPLSQGMVPWEEVFENLREVGFDGPVSLHSEYEMTTDQIIQQTARDVAYIKNFIHR